MAENLAYKASSGCWAYDNDQSNVNKYGYLYNFETAQNVCPNGYHLPSDKDWGELAEYINNADGSFTKSGDYWEDMGKLLKATSGWNSNGNGTDNYGFSALPGGGRDSSGRFGHADIAASGGVALRLVVRLRGLVSSTTISMPSTVTASLGRVVFSVRCVGN